MRQIWITKAGEPEVLQIKEAPDPTPGEGEIRIRVAASGINFADIMARMGLYQDAPPIPCVVGYEVSGTVDAVGPGVSDWKEGDRVMSFTRFGGYSDVVVVPTTYALRVPDHLDLVDMAAIPVNYVTAWLMLMDLGNLKARHQILVHAVAGGVGMAAVQIAKWRGATILGTASASKHERLKEMGVDYPIDYRNEDFEQRVMEITKGRGVDIALDAVGGESFKKSYRCTAQSGRLYLFGMSSGASSKSAGKISFYRSALKSPIWPAVKLLLDNKGVQGVNLGHLWHEVDMLREAMEEIMKLMSDGTFKPVVDAKFSFDDAAKAHHYIQDRKNFGKVLLTP
ncbi:MAG: zinc-binding dehydrogenase [Deltaproteobacteria bacterium]|nr:zinc-binding dehydrogenase [Deltaproteobacteria bacterium]MCB9490049.1 zinc-binding dehydrogenase [Deltaproteobacteria bacterium]